jgi:hypothetical protein
LLTLKLKETVGSDESYLLSFCVYLRASELVYELLKPSDHLLRKEDIQEAFSIAIELRAYDIVHLLLKDMYCFGAIIMRFDHTHFEQFLKDEIAQISDVNALARLKTILPIYKDFMEKTTFLTAASFFSAQWPIFIKQLQARETALTNAQPAKIAKPAAHTTNGFHK